MKLVIDILKKHGITALGTVIAVDGYRRSVFAHHKELKDLRAETAQQKLELANKLGELKLKNAEHLNKIELKLLELKESQTDLEGVQSKIAKSRSYLDSGKYPE